jgi:uncharacterized RDD family membrane protein YckC
MNTVYHMDPGTPRIEAATELPRAGFWRRWLAILIDTIVVMIPFQILAAVLFAMTAGMIQMDSGLFRSCEVGKTIPQGLDPPPPHDSNSMSVCRISFFGATTGATLTVGRVTRSQNNTTTVSQGYMLDKDGTPIHGRSIDWIVQLAFCAYLVGLVWKTGRTVGSRIVGVRIIDTADPAAPGVPLGKTIGRYLAIMIGAVPAFALLIYQYATRGGDADSMFTGDFFRWFSYAGVLGGLWAIVLIVQIARKRDPFYDRLAGTAVVKG